MDKYTVYIYMKRNIAYTKSKLIAFKKPRIWRLKAKDSYSIRRYRSKLIQKRRTIE